MAKYQKDKSTAWKIREVTARIQNKNCDVLNQHRLQGLTATQRRRIADEQRQQLEGVVADIYDKDIDFNFVKIHLLSHFADHIRQFGNIQMYSTESGETSHKEMIKKSYRRSNKNDASYQILWTYARLDGFKIHEIDINAYVNHPIYDEPWCKNHRRQIRSRIRRPKRLVPIIASVTQFD